MDIVNKITELKHRRAELVEKLSNLSDHQFNMIPSGYTNNIIWNLGHILVTPIHHLYSGTEKMPPFAARYYGRYLDGTHPDTSTEREEIREITRLLMPALESLETDFKAGFFTRDQGFVAQVFERALDFLIFHERMHTSKILALLQVVG